MAADEINAKGGVDGRKIEIVTYDNHSSSADSVRAFQRAVNEDKVNAVIASYISEVVLALEPWAARLKTPFITPGAASDVITQEHPQGLRAEQIHLPRLPDLGARWRCRSATPPRTCWSTASKMKTAVIMSEDAAWTKPLDAGYEECLPKIGLKVLDHIRFSPDTTDFTPIFNKIEGAEARRDHHRHLACRRAADGAMEEPAGADPDVRHHLAGDQLTFWKDTNGATEGVIYQGVSGPGVAVTPKTLPFAEAFKKKFGNYAVLCRLHRL